MNLAAIAPSVMAVGAIAFAFGLLVGSFLNVVVHRLPRGESIVWPGSRCPACSRAIRPYENIPLVSYLLLGGRCRGCGARISLRYPALELLTAVLFAVIALETGPRIDTVLWCAFAAMLVGAGAIDAEHRIIPDEISVGGLAAGLVLVPAIEAFHGDPYLAGLLRSVSGAALGGGLLWSVGFAHARLSVALGRTFEHWPGDGAPYPGPSSLDYWTWFPGLGFGDVKLLAMIGAFVGPGGVVETLLAASIAGLALGLASALVTRRWNSPFGFGPALAVGALLVILVPHPSLLP
ncbi:MAG TPA: prepilin peptidase [Myxococcota bacterium]|nr:prepilin peptidase [Myxococcota bacterium]